MLVLSLRGTDEPVDDVADGERPDPEGLRVVDLALGLEKPIGDEVEDERRWRHERVALLCAALLGARHDAAAALSGDTLGRVRHRHHPYASAPCRDRDEDTVIVAPKRVEQSLDLGYGFDPQRGEELEQGQEADLLVSGLPWAAGTWTT